MEQPPRTRVTDYATVTPETVKWLWPGRLPLGKLVLLDGDPDVGKSTVAVDLAARLTVSAMLPDGYVPGGAVNVLMLRGEDGVADTVVPRLRAAGGDAGRFMELTGVAYAPDTGVVAYRTPELPTDIDAMESVIRERRVALVIVDVLMVFLSDRVNAHRDQAVRRALGPLAAMAERTGVCFLALRHLNKAPLGSPLYRGGGSIGLIGAARTGLLVGHDPETRGRRLLAVSKCNLAARSETLAFHIVNDDRYRCGRVMWDGTSERSAADMVALAVRDDDEQARLDEALAVLFVILADGPVPARTVVTEAHQAGLSDFMLRKAKDAMGVTVHREGGSNGRWLWHPPTLDKLLGEPTDDV